jgi:L-fuculose-phosphate aldolase
MSERDSRDGLEQPWTELVATGRRMIDDDLVVGTAGNASVRAGHLILVTPSGIP